MPSFTSGGQLADDGGVIISDGDTDAHTPASGYSEFYGIVALTEVVVSAATMHASWTGTLAGETIPAGAALPVRFTSITLTSGSLVCFQR